MHSLPYLFTQAAILSQAIAICAPTGNNHTILTKTLVTTDGYTYVYDYATAANASRPTVLLLHGFPASRHDWEHTIPALAAEGYGVIAPDLLGFGDSSKPTELEAYNLKDIFVFVTVPYGPAGLFFDIDAVNALSLETLGYAQFGYWYFFNSWDTADLISYNLESTFSLVWTTNESSWGTDFANIGAARAWITANTTTEPPSWVTPEYKARWLRLYSQPNITVSSLNYYQAMLRGVHVADEAVLTDEDRKLRVPTLAVGSAKDQIATPDLQKAFIETWAVAGFQQLIVDSGHWVMQEKGDELNDILIEFIGRE
ncbi:hypothetical protein O1611_g2665 [Lasiodiplodia mahajangana]|uniref:Uncharacterized protein n=1 Tax=Lasiodiplodia mahajangana TaxID=1108764 RepID=A0ACC2JUF3_9PEZI|nr:hypothetical protein O1611_g2665 [Lasiodiplodia mahajangana]